MGLGVTETGLKLLMQLRMTLNFCTSYLHLQGVRIIGVGYQAGVIWWWERKVRVWSMLGKYSQLSSIPSTKMNLIFKKKTPGVW